MDIIIYITTKEKMAPLLEVNDQSCVCSLIFQA